MIFPEGYFGTLPRCSEEPPAMRSAKAVPPARAGDCYAAMRYADAHARNLGQQIALCPQTLYTPRNENKP